MSDEFTTADYTDSGKNLTTLKETKSVMAHPYHAGQRVLFRGMAGAFKIESCEWVQRLQCVWEFFVTAQHERTGDVARKHSDEIQVVLDPRPDLPCPQ